MVKVEFVIKGNKGNLVIKGETIDEVAEEYERNRKKIENLVGTPVKLESTRPQIAPEKLKLVPTSAQGRIAALISDSFFESPKATREVRIALKERGYTYDFEHVSIALMRLVRKRHLRRITEEREGKNIYVYVNP